MKLSTHLVKAIFFSWIFCFSVLAEEETRVNTLDDAKVYYTLQIIKHITWNNDEQLDSFVIGLLGKDQSLFDAFYSNKVDISIRGKRLIFTQIDNEKKSPYSKKQFSVIIVAKNKLSSFEQIVNTYPEALVISDGRIDRDNLMVSMITYTTHSSKQVRLELNRENLVKRGFKVSNKLLDFAGTKSDLSSQLEENEIHLNSLHTQVKEKEKKLINLNQSLKNKSQTLKLAQLTLKNKNKEIKKQELKLNLLQNERSKLFSDININQQKVTLQTQLLEKKQKEIEQQNKKLITLKNEITISEKTFQKQLIKLNEKNKMIITNEETISSQRLLLYIAIGITFILILIKINILRLSRIRKKANDELTSLNKQLYEMATTDGMTKLYNRHHYIESTQLQIAQIQRSKEVSALLMIDIDHFKNVNDTYGHAMGDEALIEVSKLLRDSLREYDIVGRLGGEEFAMFLTHCEINKAAEIAERLREKISHLVISLQDQRVYLTVSIGLTSVTSEDTDIKHVLQRADKALYFAKEHGRDQVIIYNDKLITTTKKELT